MHGGLANRVTPPVLAHLGILDRLEYAGGDSTYEGPWNSIALFDPAGAPVPALARDNAYADYEVGWPRGAAPHLSPLSRLAGRAPPDRAGAKKFRVDPKDAS